MIFCKEEAQSFEPPYKTFIYDNFRDGYRFYKPRKYIRDNEENGTKEEIEIIDSHSLKD